MISDIFSCLEIEYFRRRYGQALVSQDFNDSQRMKDVLRWIHNTALHNTWGVAGGFEVSTPSPGDPECQGVNVVCVKPGVAYDFFGREIILAKIVKVELPQADKAILVIKLGESHGDVNLHYLKTACTPFGFPMTFVRPEFLWRQRDEAQLGIEVPIATYDKNREKKIQRYLGSEARAQTRPRIGLGATQPKLTAWKKWQVPVNNGPLTIGLEVDIDTHDAGFTVTPCYFAGLNSFVFEVNRPILPLISLANERHNGFTFRMLLPARKVEATARAHTNLFFDNLGIGINLSPQAANELELTVCWVGVELLKRS